jgi:hydrogenase/urease accessory protein HupE
MKRVAAWVFLQLALAAGIAADLTNPSTLTITETSSSRFTVELTLPVVSGRVVKARPVLPDICVVDGEPEVRGDALTAIRTWTMTCDPAGLVGAPVGILGLLGTALDVLLTIETLDGRQHVQQLRATQAYFVIPPPPTLAELALGAGRGGAERLLRRPEIALLILVSVLVGARRRGLLVALLAFSAAQGLGQWLGGQRWMVMSVFLPQVAAAGTAWLVGVELMGRPLLRPGWWRPLWVPMMVLGALYGAARPETVPTLGLSTGEQSLSLVLFAGGALAGLLLLTLCSNQLRTALEGLSDGAPERWTSRVAYLSLVLAGGLFFYRLTAPFWTGGFAPAVPLVTLVAAAALGLWCRRDYATDRESGGFVLASVAGISCAAGVVVSFHGTLPLASLAVLGFLALVGARLLLPRRWPPWLDFSVIALTALYHGYYAGQILRQDATLPVAHAVGMSVLLAAVFLVCYRAIPATEPTKRPSLRVSGFLAMALAGLWQLAEVREWVGGPVAADLAMGLARLPVLAAVLLLAAWLAWPRRRRFASQHEAGTAGTHWGLLGLAFFVLPLGTLRVDIPFHAPDAPSAAEARRVMDTLLTDTYLAFNLADEDAAFDRLAQNLSQKLVADVYLDSRRRLRAGTREGAEVTVRDVSVMEVDDAIGTADNAFTYPCQWVVTARVRHLQHIHNRQNVYAGELTLQVEDDRWKIAALDLLSEERVVLSWRSS